MVILTSFRKPPTVKRKKGEEKRRKKGDINKD